MRELMIRLPRLGPIRTSPDDPRLFSFNNERDAIVHDVVERVTTGRSPGEVERLLADAAYEEIRRLESQRDAEASADLSGWRSRARRIHGMDAGERSAELARAASHYAWDIAGNFDPRVFRFVTRLVPTLLTGVMAPSTLPNLLGGDRWLGDRVLTQGDTDLLRRLSKNATLVITPTHSSNLDSVVFGFALERAGLPPVTYGAGKNLFTNPFISFFMHNLGAYRVDRRIRALLYKEVLKAYSCVLIERGYHSLFFPGGTRSRSGGVETRVKLGLLGSAVEAWVRSVVSGHERPVAIVPLTINYVLTLEAESLIREHLKESGRAQFIMEDDEFSQLDRWNTFFRKTLMMDAAVILRFGTPIDPFGYRMDDTGASYDSRGRLVDRRSYVLKDGVPAMDANRDAEYTRELGEIICQHFKRETVVVSTAVVAKVLFARLAQALPGLDLYQRLRMRGQVIVPREEVLADIDALRGKLRALADQGKLVLSPVVDGTPAPQLLERALSAWSGYHTRPAARWQDGGLVLEDLNLLYYYQNRLGCFAKDLAATTPAHASRAAEATR
ncbi:MAG: 1-acyl-sn-glycerol-3-phosphate acyltransferase [Deltaproteobacteria bacterium]|nr:1-acyl-sn-glycerol-3-phosphate acyltransferase [Deltaproteobacteria bacterium]